VIQSHAAHASRAPAIRALPRCRTGIPGHTKGGRVPTRRAGCARRDSDPHDLAATDPSSLRVYQFRHERMRAPDPDRTGACRLRDGRSCRLSYKGIATRVGIEPTCSRVRTWAGCQQPSWYRVRAAGVEPAPVRGLSSLSLPVGSRPLGAPPGARTLFPGLRVRCITCHACSASSGPAALAASETPHDLASLFVSPLGAGTS
jgi:hypothetical protein